MSNEAIESPPHYHLDQKISNYQGHERLFIRSAVALLLFLYPHQGGHWRRGEQEGPNTMRNLFSAAQAGAHRAMDAMYLTATN